MSVILLWHLANWNGFSLVDVFPQQPVFFYILSIKHTDRANNCHSAVKQAIEIQNGARGICSLSHLAFAFLRYSFSWKLWALSAEVDLAEVGTFLVSRERGKLYCTVALSLAGNIHSSALWPSAIIRASLLKTHLLQEDEAERALVINEQQK